MARISVSLPDELNTELGDYIAKSGQVFSVLSLDWLLARQEEEREQLG